MEHAGNAVLLPHGEKRRSRGVRNGSYTAIYDAKRIVRSRNELVTTKVELKAMAAAAMIGLSCQPKNG